jgi:hypothetical protein
MATVGSILANVRRMYGDPDADFLSDTIGMEWLDKAQQRFCDEVMPLDEIKDYTVVQKQPRFDLPSDCIVPTSVMWYKNKTWKISFKFYTEMDRMISASPNSIGSPQHYTVFRRQLVVGPQTPNSDSATTTGSGEFGSTATAIGFTAASGVFRSKGFLKNSTTGEVIEYTTLATTQISGATRGVHGTSAATCASGQQWTEIDMQMSYRKMPAVLTATTSSPEIPAIWHRYLEAYVLYQAWLARGDSAKAGTAFEEFAALERTAREKAGRRAWETVTIKDRRNYGFYGV